MAISITHRSDLSLLYRILRTIIKPLRPRLVAPKKQNYVGSPRLKNHPRRIGKVKIIEREVQVSSTESPFAGFDAYTTTKTESVWVYEFHPPSNSHSKERSTSSSERRTTQIVYYFAGGGFQSPPSSEHWKFCAYITADLAPDKVRIVLVSYPLAPRSPACDALPLLRRWLVRTLAEELVVDRNENVGRQVAVTLAGDSSGANIALSLGLWCAQQAAFAEAGAGSGATEGSMQLHRVRAVLLISPPMDLRSNANESADALLADKLDPVLGKRMADRVAEAWTKGSDARDSYLSPGLADVKDLRRGKIGVYGVVGTADVLAPGALAFVEKCDEHYLHGKWLVWEDQMHCFPLAACYGLREGKQAREWIVKILREVR